MPLAAILLTLAVALPLLAWGVAGREAAWRAGSRIEQGERDRQRRDAEAAARRLAARLEQAMESERRGHPHPWVRLRLSEADVPEPWREPARRAQPGTFALLGARLEGREVIVALARSDDALRALVLDHARIEQDEGVQLRPIMLGHGARLPMTQARMLPWGVHDEDPVAMAAALDRAAAATRDFDRLFALGVAAATCGWALALVVLAQSLADERRRARLAAVAAHELRTPLASLAIHAEALADDGSLGDAHRRRAVLIASEAARLGRTVSNVLDGARLERAGLTLAPRAGDLAAVVRSECERLRPSLERDGVRLALDVPDGPVEATFDEEAFAHAFGNLVENAARHGRADGHAIEILVRRESSSAVVEVVDHGPGLGAGRSRRGLGLGLGIARRLTLLQGGALDLLPTPGGGVTARMTLR